MTATGVQNIGSAAYVPPPPSTSSTPDAKGSGAGNSQAAGTSEGHSDFQSELAQQQSSTQQTGAQPAGKLAVKPGKKQDKKQDQESAGQAKTEPAKADSGQPEKKRDAQSEDVNLSAAIPVHVAEPQKQMLPLALAVALPQETAQLDENAKSGENAALDGNAAETAPQTAQVPVSSAAAGGQIADLPQSVAPKQSVKSRQPADVPDQTPGANPVPSGTPDSSAVQVLLASISSLSSLAPGVPVQGKATKSEGRSSQDQATTSTEPGASSEYQPVSPVELNLPAVPAEPVASAVQESADSVPSTPSALAFAARMAAVSQQANQPVAANPITSNAGQVPPVPASETSAQIPVRYAATAQIIQSAALGTKPDESKKELGAALDQSVRADAQAGIRTDMVTPRVETTSQAPLASAPAAPPQATPATRMEPVIEPPPAPPTSNHDIRVRVPDNNGGSTQIRFVESGGEVRVSVRTTDDGLAQNLRTHLNDLTQRLSDGGMPAEIWKPAANSASSQNDQHQPHQDGRGPGGQGSGAQDGQQERQQRRPAWLDEMEASLHAE